TGPDKGGRSRHDRPVLPRLLRRCVSRARAAAARDGQVGARTPGRADAPHPAAPNPGTRHPGTRHPERLVLREGLSYQAAGVDVGAYEHMLERVRPLISATHGPAVVSGIGPFAGLYELPGGGRLAASADSVGTKV